MARATPAFPFLPYAKARGREGGICDREAAIRKGRKLYERCTKEEKMYGYRLKRLKARKRQALIGVRTAVGSAVVEEAHDGGLAGFTANFRLPTGAIVLVASEVGPQIRRNEHTAPIAHARVGPA